MGEGSRHLSLVRTPRHATANRRHAHNFFLLAAQQADLGETALARATYGRALACDPTYLPALRALADLEYAAGNLAEAQQCVTRALDTVGPDPDLLFLQGNIALSQGQAAEALEAYRLATALEGDSSELRFNIGLAHLFLGESDAAASVLEALALEQPDNARVWDALGCARRQLHNPNGAIEAFLKALDADPMHNDTRDHLAQLLLELQQVHRAQQVLESALTLDPERRSSLHLLGMAYAASRDYARAVHYWRRLVDLGDAYAETYHMLVNAYLRLQERDEAKGLLAAMVARFPDHLQARLQLGLMLLEDGAWASAWEHLDHARALAPHDPMVAQAVASAKAITPEAAR